MTVDSMLEKKRKKGHWSRMQDIIPEALKSIPCQRDNMVEWTSLQWFLSVGGEIAEISQVEKESAKTLYILVAGEEWLKVLRGMEKKILLELNRRFDQARFSRILFKTGQVARAKPTPGLAPDKRASRPVNPDQTQSPKTDLTFIKDAGLRKILERLSKKIRFTAAVLACAFLSSCASVVTTGEKVDLSESYAVRKIEQLNQKKPSPGYRDPRSYYFYLMALKAERKKNFKEAAGHYMQAATHDPAKEEFIEKLVLFLLRSGQLESAVDWGAKAVERFPKNVDVRLVLANVLSAMGQAQKALDHYKKITEIDPGNSKAYLFAGYTLYTMGQDAEAQESFKQAILVEESNPFSLFYLAKSQARQGYVDKAINNFKKTLTFRPSFLLAREHLAWYLEGQGKYAETVDQYKIILKLTPKRKKIGDYLAKVAPDGQPAGEIDIALFNKYSPPPFKDPDVHMLTGVILYEQAVYGKAIDEFRLLLHKKEDKALRLSLAKIYELYGRLDQAIEEVEAFRRSGAEPDSLDTLLSLARLYGLDDKIEKSIQLIKEAIALEPEKDSLYHSLALAYMSDSQNVSAIKNMRKAIELNGKIGTYYFELGALLEREGQYENAVKSMQKALELNPNHSNAHNFIGYIYSVRGENLDKALDHLTKALAIQPKNGYFLDSLGWIYYQKGDSKRALAEMKRALVYTSPDPVLYDHLGDVYFSLKNYREARRAWKTSLTLTLKKDKDYTGEIPDSDIVQEKIRKVDRILQISY